MPNDWSYVVRSSDVRYSDRYEDATYTYRHVTLPWSLASEIPVTHLLTETEWRNLGLQMSSGWCHYMTTGRGPIVLCFRRPKDEPETNGS